MKKFFIVLFCIFLISCNRATERKKSDDLLNEYSSIFYNSLESNEEIEIQKGIVFIQKLLDEGYSQDIYSIYYNKAQLYVKLAEYQNAIESLKRMEDGLFRDLLESTLLIKSGDQNKAKIILKSMYKSYDIKLLDPHLKQNKRIAFICDKLQIIKLLNEDYDSYYHKIISNKEYSDTELKKIEETYNTANEELINGFWPN